MSEKRKIRAAMYLRISEDRYGDGLAHDRQEMDCRRIAKERGWTIVTTYTDTLGGFKRAVTRPGYERMRADFDAGRFEAIVCWDLDRLTRQPRQLEDWIEAAEERGLLLTTANGEADLSMDGGRMYARIKASVARGEIEAKIRRQKSKNQQLVNDGTPIIGVRPFGFEVDRLEIREAEAVHIRAGFATILTGGTLHAVQRSFNDSGMLTTRGNKWSYATVRQMMLRPRNAGLLMSKGEIAAEGLSAIVTPEELEQVTAILTDPSRATAPGPKVMKHFATGLVMCGVCGSPMRSSSARSRGRVLGIYKCSRKIEGHDIGDGVRHPTIQREILEGAIPREVFKALLALAKRGAAYVTENPQIGPLRVQRAEVDRRRAVAQEIALMPGANLTTLRTTLAGLAKEGDAIDAQLADALRSTAHAEVLQTIKGMDQIFGHIQADGEIVTQMVFGTNHPGAELFEIQWDEMSIEDKRALVRATLKITVNPAATAEKLGYFHPSFPGGWQVLRPGPKRIQFAPITEGERK